MRLPSQFLEASDLLHGCYGDEGGGGEGGGGGKAMLAEEYLDLYVTSKEKKLLGSLKSEVGGG